MIKKIGEAEFEEVVLKSTKPVLVGVDHAKCYYQF